MAAEGPIFVPKRAIMDQELRSSHSLGSVEQSREKQQVPGVG